jgi:hypothetical protein
LSTSNPVVYQDLLTNGFFTGTTIGKAQLLRPYPNINNLTNGRDPGGEQKYNHLEATITKRLSHGYSFQASYLWSSNIERISRENEFDESPIWRPSQNSAPHNFNANFIYELPFGKGKKFLSGNKWLGALVGGWQFSGIYVKQSGRSYDLGNWFYYGNDLHDIAKDTKEQSVSDWFNWQLFPGASRFTARRTGRLTKRASARWCRSQC